MANPAVVTELKGSRSILATTVVGGHGLKHLYAAAFSIILPEIKDALALSNAAAGAIITSREVSGGLITLPAGFLADRYARHWAYILTASMLLIGLGFLLAGSFSLYGVIVVGVILSSIGTSIWHPAAIASLSRRFPFKRGFAISLHGAGGSVGEVLGPLIAGSLLLVLVWDRLLQVSLIPLVLAAVLVWGALKGMEGQQGVSSAREYFAGIGKILKNKTLLAVVLISGSRSMGQITLVTFVPIYLREDLEYSSFITGVYVSLLQAVGVATHPIMGFLSDRFGRRAVLTPGMVIFGLLSIALAFAAPGVPLTLTIIAIGAFIFTFHSIFVAAAMDIVPEEVHGSSVALIYASSFGIGAIGPVIGGTLADVYGIGASFIFAGSIVMTAGLLLQLLRRLPQPRTTAG